MTYFKINGVDYSQYVNKLNIQTNHMYNARTNASGDTAVKYINSKHIITVGIIPLDSTITRNLITAINEFKVTISYMDPATSELRNAICIIPKNNVEYYTVRADKILTKAYTLTFEEL